MADFVDDEWNRDDSDAGESPLVEAAAGAILVLMGRSKDKMA